MSSIFSFTDVKYLLLVNFTLSIFLQLFLKNCGGLALHTMYCPPDRLLTVTGIQKEFNEEFIH